MHPFVQDSDFVLYVGDALDVLRQLPDGCVDCVVTSPPYWGLRDYGTGSWERTCPWCDHTGETPGGKCSNCRRLLGWADCDHRRPLGGGKAKGATLSGTGNRDGYSADGQYAQVCADCGARRVDRQLGLEPTPDEYVANMVAVFREVRRVLAAHGTCWVNLGDSYAGVAGGRDWSPNLNRGRKCSTSEEGRIPVARPPGLKPKDLVGIPWRVAFALQQPWYAGRITSEADRIWLAAMVDTEGCIHIHKRSAGAKSHTHTLADGSTVDYERKTDTYGVMVSIDNTSKALIDRIAEIVGQGSRYTHEKGVGKSNRKQTLYRITLTGQQSRDLLRELYPYLVAKQHEARIAYHSPSSGDGSEAAWLAIKALHNGASTTVDYPEPPTLFEPGWYLRSDVIWGKPNPMPESVTDRPTKSHEYVFLLSKGPRYFFDQEAVREPSSPNTHSRGQGIGVKNAGTEFGQGIKHNEDYARAINGHVSARNIRSVWEIATQPYAEAHFATYPEALVERCLKAGCPEWVCSVCGRARERIVDKELKGGHAVPNARAFVHGADGAAQGGSYAGGSHVSGHYEVTTLGWSDCGHNNYRPGIVLDPFMGSGTTALVARRLGRHAVGIELNVDYAALCARRLQQLSLLAEGTA